MKKCSGILSFSDDEGKGERLTEVDFKRHILELAHKLELKGWQNIPVTFSNDLVVERLSGALTNAVFVVSLAQRHVYDGPVPPKLLLRIYGPHVEHLIDRERELSILRRLSQRSVGPRVLGIFSNGRFEQFYEARALTPLEMRSPDVSKSIAKRMRELHEGVELLGSERDEGPNVWRNWDKWVDRCERIVTWLDNAALAQHKTPSAHYSSKSIKTRKTVHRFLKKHGFVLGLPWPRFRKAVEEYREYLKDRAAAAGSDLKQDLVFAHNDTQYGNILRIQPNSESPLLFPANQHKQLVVIDFEYASANTRACEFANHFTEWTYNYHDAEQPWKSNLQKYPTPEEQMRFIRAYLNHVSHPHFTSSPNISPLILPASKESPKVKRRSSFSLDEPALPLERTDLPRASRHPQPSPNIGHASPSLVENEALKLIDDTRFWRPANSVQWVTWGVMQAEVPVWENETDGGTAEGTTEDDEVSSTTRAAGEPRNESSGNGLVKDDAGDSDTGEVDEEDFDYLAYANDRALFFFADLLALKLMDESEFPANVLESIKTRILEY